MMRRLSICVVAAALAACSGSRPEPPAKSAANQGEPGDGVAYFAGGCFWGVEHYMEKLDGVTGVESGYMGGHVDSPTYEQVSSKTSGHLEAVRVRYHTDEVSYEEVAKLFFEIHDPTQTDGQGPDIGPEYLSAVFYTSPEQQQTAASLIGKLEKRGFVVATTLRPAARFWLAEEYHQNYYVRKGSKPYCHTRVRRFGD